MNDIFKPFRELLFSPPVHFSRDYIRRDFRHDLVAGLTVAVLAVPQCMAYAMIAGVPPIYGIYTAIVGGMVGSIFGSSNHLATGPTNATCMVIFSVTAPYLDSPSHLEIVLLLTLLTGLMELAFGLLRIGNVVRYVSNSVVIGFTSGVAILIVGNQLSNVLGVRLAQADYLHFHTAVIGTFSRIGDTQVYVLGVALFTLVVVVACRLLDKRVPGPLLSMIFGAALVHLAGWGADHGVRTVRDISALQGGLGLFRVPELALRPDLALTKQILSGAFALAVFGLIESSTSARGVAALSGQRLTYSRDFVAIGLSNIVGSFLSCFVSSGSFVRSALCYHAGGRTRVAQFSCAVFIAAALLFLSSYAGHIPQASLAGLLLYVAYNMISKQKDRISMTWRSGGNSRLVMIATFFSTLILPLQYAIFAGIFLSIFLLLRITGKANIKILIPDEEGRFGELPLGQTTDSPIVLIDMEGDFYFAAVENLDLDLQRALTPNTRVVILRMKGLRAVGSTAITVLDAFREMLLKRNIALVICGVEKSLEGIIRRSRLRDRVGEPNIFYADSTVFQSTSLAMARARAIVKMERLIQEAETESPARAAGWPAARDLMIRSCIRFGRRHTVREAVWLFSEINQRSPGLDPQPLFLQDEEGHLAGELTVWNLLETMRGELDGSALAAMSDQELGAHFSRSFNKVIKNIAERNLPHLDADARLPRLMTLSVRRNLDVLPICDAGRRVVGAARQSDVLNAVAQGLQTASREKKE